MEETPRRLGSASFQSALVRGALNSGLSARACGHGIEQVRVADAALSYEDVLAPAQDRNHGSANA